MTTTLYDLYETSEKAEIEDGIMIEIPGAGVKIWTRRAGGANTKFTRFVETENRKFRVAGRELTNAAGEEILKRGLARHCIFQWEGVTDRKGKVLECNAENAEKLMTDLPSLIMVIYQQASNPDNFLASEAQLEEESGN
jgi:hypothetical protein